MAGLLARDSISGRLPGQSTSDILPFVLAYSGGSAGDSRDRRYTPLPYQARAGTVIRYSIVIQPATRPMRYHAASDLSRTFIDATSFDYNGLSGYMSTFPTLEYEPDTYQQTESHRTAGQP